MFYAGTDPGKSLSYVTAVDEMGKVVRQGKAESTPEGLLSARASLWPQVKVAMEATRARQEAYDVLADQGPEATLSTPHRVQGHRLGQGGEATRWAPTSWPSSCGQTFLVRAYVPDPETRALRELLRRRVFLVEIRRAVKNRIHARL